MLQLVQLYVRNMDNLAQQPALQDITEDFRILETVKWIGLDLQHCSEG